MLRHNELIASEPVPAARPGRAAVVVCGLLVSAVFAMACVTVNIYFPAPEVRQAAERIIDETWGSQGAPAAAPSPSQEAPGKQSAIARGILLAALGVISPREADAAEVDVNLSTASIRALKDGMRQRAAELKPYLASGAVGIANNGLLVARDAAGMGLAAKAKVRRLVDAENKDREELYREIAAANNYGAEHVSDIRSIFAQTWTDKAEAGWWVQGADGSWRQK